MKNINYYQRNLYFFWKKFPKYNPQPQATPQKKLQQNETFPRLQIPPESVIEIIGTNLPIRNLPHFQSPSRNTQCSNQSQIISQTFDSQHTKCLTNSPHFSQTPDKTFFPFQHRNPPRKPASH